MHVKKINEKIKNKKSEANVDLIIVVVNEWNKL